MLTSTPGTRMTDTLFQRDWGPFFYLVVVPLYALLNLSGFVLYNVFGFLEESNVRATEITMRNVEQGLLIYAARHQGKYPTTADGLASVTQFLYTDELPTDAWDRPFLYVSPGIHGNQPYEIISLGRDGKEGGRWMYSADLFSSQLPD